MISAIQSPYLVPFDETFSIDNTATLPPSPVASKKEYKKKLKHKVKQLGKLQRVLYAHNKYAVLLIFQAMDAAGKDSTIRAVLTGVNPAGCRVISFKQPSSEELEHDFLWRTTCNLPERGKIGVFNRSYYEELLVVRVHPELLDYQNLPNADISEKFWEKRIESIRNHEQHLAENGTLVLKFWLNVSKEEQKNRFLSRLNEPEKHWKFSESDLKEREFWPKYMKAFEHVLDETSRPWAPWFAIPADNKPFMRYTVAKIIVEQLEQLDLNYPEIDDDKKVMFSTLREQLMNE